MIPRVTTKRTFNGHEVVEMEPVDELAVDAHRQLTLAPDGDHLTSMTLKELPKVGEKVKLTLHFEPDGKDLTMELPVAPNQP
jgi:copper(I)-binding protein